MSFIFDIYIPGSSFLHNLDPRVKLWGALCSVVMVFWLPGLLLPAILLSLFHLVLLMAGVSARRLLKVWRQMAVLVALILFLQPFFHPDGRVIIALGPLKVTFEGIYDALRLAIRAMGFTFAFAIVLFSTEHPMLVLAFVRLGLPYTWGLTISLALRFLPAIQNLFHAIRDAQAARGWLASGGIFKRFREYFPVLIAVIVGTLRMSDQLTLALAARGLDTSDPRSRWHDLHMRASDWAWIAVLTFGFTGFIWWRIAIS